QSRSGSATKAAGPPRIWPSAANAAGRLRSLSAGGVHGAGRPGSSRYRGLAAKMTRAEGRDPAVGLSRAGDEQIVDRVARPAHEPRVPDGLEPGAHVLAENGAGGIDAVLLEDE